MSKPFITQFLLYVMSLQLLMAHPAQASLPVFSTDSCRVVDGCFPVYSRAEEVYMGIPLRCMGREVLVSAQIDHGFDLVARPAGSIGVARLMLAPDSSSIGLVQPFYAERVVDSLSVQQSAFALSNTSAPRHTLPVVGITRDRLLVVRLTELLMEGEEWCSYPQFSAIRTLVPDMSRLRGVHATADGVSLTVERWHETESDGRRFSSSNMVLPMGSKPLVVTCCIRLLPTGGELRLADSRVGAQTMRYLDHSQHPYAAMADSLLLHWPMHHPLVIYTDTLVPRSCLAALRAAVQVWNKALRVAGLSGNILQVRPVTRGQVTASLPFLISYDLLQPEVSSSLVAHPRTGEILSARIHVGRHFEQPLLQRYLLSGEKQAASLNRVSRREEIVSRLLQAELMREIGRMLGLQHPVTPHVNAGEPVELSAADQRFVHYAYAPSLPGETAYARRSRMQQWLDSQPSLSPVDSVALAEQRWQHTLPVWQHLDRYREAVKTSGSSLRTIYQTGIDNYLDALNLWCRRVVNSADSSEQRRAMRCMERYLCGEATAADCAFVRQKLMADKRRQLYPALRKLLGQLVSSQTVARLYEHSLLLEDAYSTEQFFDDVDRMFFNHFDSQTTWSSEQLDLQSLLLTAWADNLKSSDPSSASDKGRQLLEAQWHRVMARIETLSHSHVQADVRDLYTLLLTKLTKDKIKTE